MTTLMIHPQHGATHAYGATDVKWHEDRGWKVLTEESLKETAQAAAAEPEKRKPGRPKAK